MTSYSISDAKNQLSALLAKVRRGARIVITDRGVPVAVLGPVTQAEAPTEADEARLARLEREGVIRRGTGKFPSSLLREAPPRALGGASAVEALLEERRSGR
jgi:prevent-host-death family protein